MYVYYNGIKVVIRIRPSKIMQINKLWKVVKFGVILE